MSRAPGQVSGALSPVTSREPLTVRRVFTAWWPLAASWLLMGFELPSVSAAMARLSDPKINLAAYGGVVFPIALLIEAPVIMLLAASTALSRDRNACAFVRRCMMRMGGILTALHILVAFTPLYDVVTRNILAVPEEIRLPARVGLMIMTPWTWSIAYRRFNQGVLIRFGRSRAVGIGTFVRLMAIVVVLAGGLLVKTIPGIVVGAAAVTAGVLSEAIFSGIMVGPVVKGVVPDTSEAAPLTIWSFLDFYIPLAMTSLIFLAALPIGSAAMSRMPRPLDSLAVWPVLSGLVFVFRSTGFGLNEVVVALFDEPGAAKALKTFTWWLAGGLTTLLLAVAASPLGRLWMSGVSALPDSLTRMAVTGLLLSVPLPAIATIQSLHQGTLVYFRKTRSVTESVVAYLVINALVLGAGVLHGHMTGLYIAVLGMDFGGLAMVLWLWHRARQAYYRAA